ncbi:UDP-glucuronosyltransferase 2C1 [Papilio xuthus]|nr:UDP-glucuronosyltransferase 2C1 [Papilio xuthus]
MFETVYHGVPIVSIPVFCDHEANAAKAEVDGYAKILDLQYLTSDKLYRAIKEVIDEPKYRIEVKKRQILLRDQKETPLERAIYWTEYVIRHKGAYHLLSPAKDLNFFQYYLLDVALAFIVILITISVLIAFVIRRSFHWLIDYLQSRRMDKLLDNSSNLLKSSKKLIDSKTIVKKNL